MARIWLASAVALALTAYAGGALASDYLMEGVDNARTGWVKDEKVLTKANLPKMKLLWSKKLPGAEPRVYHNLYSPLIAESLRTPSGVKEVAVEAGVSDMLWGLDAKTGDVLWSKHFDYTANNGVVPASNNRLCPGGQTAVPTMEKMPDGTYKVWALSGDGRLWQVNAATGENIAPPVKFAPDNGKPFALNLYNGYIYTAMSQGCGGDVFQFDAFDTKTQKSSAFYPAGGGLWGRRGAAIDKDGVAWMGTGDGSYLPGKNLGNMDVGVKPDANGELQVVKTWAPLGANWMWKRDLDINVSPMVVSYKGKDFLLTTSKECVLYLTDLSITTGKDPRTALSTQDVCNDRKIWDEKGVWGAISGGQTADGQEWVYMPFWGEKAIKFNPPIKNTPLIPDSNAPDRQAGHNGGVAAFTIAQVGGKWTLVPQWLSQNMNMGEEGLLANDIFWVYASGTNARQIGRDVAYNDTTMAFGDPHDLGTHATIYALDAKTGKTLWSSGDQITTWNHFSGITVANGKVYTGTYDGTLWCFGVAN